jgi:hypothetical protein
MSDVENVARKETNPSSPYRTASDHEVTHVTLRIVELDDGYRVTEPGVTESVTRADIHEAIAEYTRLTKGEDSE